MRGPTAVPDPVIELSGISKDYHGLRPLRIEALTLAAGERAAILGFDQPMAETFVNLVTGATLPDRGDVRVFGRSTAAISDGTDWLAFVDRFGIVSARAVLLDGLSVLQNLAMAFTLEIDPPPEDVRERAVRLAQEVGLPDGSLTQAVAALDDLGRVRIRLARALALDPAILVLEHISAGLPPQETASLGFAIRQVVTRRGIAVIAASADQHFATAVAARVLTHEPATGRLAERQGGFFGRLFGP